MFQVYHSNNIIGLEYQNLKNPLRWVFYCLKFAFIATKNTFKDKYFCSLLQESLCGTRRVGLERQLKGDKTMGRPIKRTESSTIDSGYPSGYGGTIGQPYSSSGVKTINFQYNTSANVAIANGYGIQQKGASKFTLGDSSNIGANVTIATLVNAAPASLTASQASVLCYNTSNVAFYAKRITDKFVYDWSNHKYIYKINKAATANWANVAVK